VRRGKEEFSVSFGHWTAFRASVGERFRKQKRTGCLMKLQTILRMQAITIGFGAALFLATCAPAQEIDNTVWADDSSASVTSTTPAAPTSTSNDVNMTAAKIQAAPVSEDDSSILANRASLSEVVPANRWGIAFLLLCLGVVAWYMRETAKRVERKSTSEWRKL
jgi:hypothetical protein